MKVTEDSNKVAVSGIMALLIVLGFVFGLGVLVGTQIKSGCKERSDELKRTISR